MDFSNVPNKKVYEFVLSSCKPSSDLKNALQSIVRRAIEDSSHFEFLLHKVNWFIAPFSDYLELLEKVVRLYRGKGKEAAKVAYNLLIQTLSIQQSHKLALQTLIGLVKDAFHSEIFIQCVKENYPHKLCPLEMHTAYMDSLIGLSRAFPKHRFQFLQIIIQNLASFDTQLLVGDSFSNSHFPQDYQLKDLRKNVQSQIAQKYDILLKKFLEYLETEQKTTQFLRQIFEIFQNKILPIKSTKIIQFVVYYVANSTKKMSNDFTSLLLGNIFDQNTEKENWYRIFTQSNFYLVSYVIRSTKISFNAISQIVRILMNYLIQRLENLENVSIDETIRLKQIFYENERNLQILQSILMICAYQPGIRAKFQHQYNLIIKQATRKLHFQYFLNKELLDFLDLKLEENQFNLKQRSHKLVLKYSNKFNPIFLPQVGQIVDKIYKQRCFGRKATDSKMIDSKKKRVNKDQLSFCQASDTGPSHHELHE